MTNRLTPYDTGERLEPKPWTAPVRGTTVVDRLGKVDYDDECGNTVVVVHVERTDSGG